MDYIFDQTDTISKLSQIIHDESDPGYELARCVSEVDEDSVDEYFEFFISGEKINRSISDENGWHVLNLVLKLHQLMKEHSGGEWEEMELTLDSDGRANTKFTYPE